MKESLPSRMNNGEFLTVVQLHPPKRTEIDSFTDAVSQLKETGVTIFDINASPQAERLDSFTVGSQIAEPGIEVMTHVTAREGLTKIKTQVSEGYKKDNIRHVLAIKGDKPKDGSQTTSTLATILGTLTDLRSQEGKHVAIATAVNQNAVDLSREATMVKTKIQNGTDFFMSQIVFDPAQARQLHEFYSPNADNKPLIAGVWPLTDSKSVERIYEKKIPGVIMPDEIYAQAIQYKDDPKQLKEWSFAQAKQTIETIKQENLAQGIYLVAPINTPIELVDFIKTLN